MDENLTVEEKEARDRQEDREDNEDAKNPFISQLQLQASLIDSKWGRDGITKDLKRSLNLDYLGTRENPDGSTEEVYKDENRWSKMSFFSRDYRLGNLDSFNGEMEYCQYYTDLANDLFISGMKESSLISLERNAGRLELSQSKGGFLRKRLGTGTIERIRSDNTEAPRRSFFGGRR